MECEGEPRFEERDIRAGRFVYGHYSEARYSEKPEANEDRLFVNPELRAAGIFDGMGGYEHGAEAANLVAELFRESMASWPVGTGRKQTVELLRQAFPEINLTMIKSFAGKIAERGGPGTTATVVKLIESESAVVRAVIGNVADSRAWVRRNSGLLELLTVDNASEANSDEQINKAKNFQERMSRISVATELQPPDSFVPHNNVVSGPFGSLKVKFRIYQAEFNPGEFLLLTTDGVHDNLTIQEMEELIRYGGGGGNGSSVIAERLVHAAGERSHTDHLRAKPDDRTAVVLHYPRENEEEAY